MLAAEDDENEDNETNSNGNQPSSQYKKRKRIDPPPPPELDEDEVEFLSSLQSLQKSSVDSPTQSDGKSEQSYYFPD